MAKKRKLKKGVIIIIGIIAFFVVYALAFRFGLSLDNKEETPVETQDEVEDTRPLMTQIKGEKTVFISDEYVEDVKIEEVYWSDIKYYFNEFPEVREPEKFEEVYKGYSDNGIRFSTDLNYVRLYTVNVEEYYKVPVGKKEEFQKVLNESIYTSFDFIKQYKSWDVVKVTLNDETKKISKRKFDELAYTMLPKRSVGKVQPEKSKEKSEYNFTIHIQGEGYEALVETMGQDYVKITHGELVGYYEVHTKLYEHLMTEIFKIEN